MKRAAVMADEEFDTSRDYFVMVRLRVVEHTREDWRSFRDGHAAMRSAESSEETHSQ
jgi:hypothetical protein